MAGVTRGAQVHHFGSKNDLVIAALKHLAAKRAAAAVGDVGDLTASDDRSGRCLICCGTSTRARCSLRPWNSGWPVERIRQLGREVAKFESIVASSLMAAVGAVCAEELHKPMLDFLYTAMDALRGILIASFVDVDPSRARRRWDRAATNLRRSRTPWSRTGWRRVTVALAIGITRLTDAFTCRYVCLFT